MTPIHLTRTEMEKRRMEAARMLMEGQRSQSEIGRQLGVTRAAVNLWAGQMKAGGVSLLMRRKPSGRPYRLGRAQRRRLSVVLRRGATASGFGTDRWTLERIQQVIQRRFHVIYHPKYIGRLMRKLGWDFRPTTERGNGRGVASRGVWMPRPQ